MSKSNNSGASVPWMSICAGIVASLIQHSQGEDWVIAAVAAMVGSTVVMLGFAMLAAGLATVSRNSGFAVFGCLPLIASVVCSMVWPFYLMAACYYNWWMF